MRYVLLSSFLLGLLFYLQSNSLTIRNFTLSVPDTNPAVTVNAPAVGGTLATQEFVTARAPTTDFRGSINLLNGAGSVTFPNAISNCIVSDPSGNSVKYTRGPSSLSVQGVGPTIDYSCK